MKRLYESLLDDEAILMNDTGEQLIKYNFLKNNAEALSLRYFDDAELMQLANNPIDTWTIKFNELNQNIPNAIKFGTINEITLLSSDNITQKFIKDWSTFPQCNNIIGLEINIDEHNLNNGFGDLSKMKVDKISTLNLYISMSHLKDISKIFKNTKAPKGKMFCVNIQLTAGLDSDINEPVDRINLDLQNIKGFNAQYILFDERYTRWTNWDARDEYSLSKKLSLKKDPIVIKEIDDMFKNNNINEIILKVPEYRSYKNKLYMISKSGSKYKLAKMKS